MYTESPLYARKVEQIDRDNIRGEGVSDDGLGGEGRPGKGRLNSSISTLTRKTWEK